MWFLRFQEKFGHAKPLPMQQNLPKSAQIQNFEMPPKIEILMFFKKKNYV
jgi:hypothetical protein